MSTMWSQAFDYMTADWERFKDEIETSQKGAEEGAADDDLLTPRRAEGAQDPPRGGEAPAAGEVREADMKDPMVVCASCLQLGGRIRKLSGVRCRKPQCPKFKEVLASDAEMIQLKTYLNDQVMLAWAHRCQHSGPIKTEHLRVEADPPIL